jgi:hypothetical protein
LQNTPYCPISVLALPAQWNAFEVLIPSGWNAKPIPLGSDSNFNHQNTQCIHLVKIFATLELDQKFLFFKGLLFL